MLDRQVAGSAVDIGEVPRDLYIDGGWRATGQTFPVTNPANGSVVAEVASGGGAEAIAALDAAVRAQAEWRAVSPRERANLLHEAHRLMADRADLFAQVMTLESGKPLTESRAEFGLSADFFLWFCEQVAHLHGSFSNASR